MSNKVFLITGCSSGIGKTLAKKLSDLGHVVYAGVRVADSLSDVASATLLPIAVDVNDAQAVDSAIERITQEQGRLDGLINNAGYGAMGPLTEVPVAQVRKQYETNVFAPLALVQKSLPLLQKSPRSMVVNIGSATGYFSVPFSGAYNSSKAALHSLSDVLRMELAHCDVHVMTVYPGGVSSSFGDNAALSLADTLAPNSQYLAASGAIEKRARVSSNSPTTPEIFAEQLIVAMFKTRPPARISIGHGSKFMRILAAILPNSLREYAMRRAFGLTRMPA
jgi:short-subunit dehydrogenase